VAVYAGASIQPSSWTWSRAKPSLVTPSITWLAGELEERERVARGVERAPGKAGREVAQARLVKPGRHAGGEVELEEFRGHVLRYSPPSSPASSALSGQGLQPGGPPST
jgi:hypothetical protein